MIEAIVIAFIGAMIIGFFGLIAFSEVSFSNHDSDVEIAKAKAREAEANMKKQELIVKELELRGKE